MKTLSANLTAHIATTVTTLATIWRVTRRDGENFYLTDHDLLIPFDDGDGVQNYISTAGFNRTAIASNTGLAVDNINVSGLFDADVISNGDLRAGIFDYAVIQVGIVNWAAPGDGAIKMRKGRLGEVTFSKKGGYTVELRGLTQNLSQNIISLYSAECRADLGDAKCGIPIALIDVPRLTTLTMGQNFRFPTGTLTSIVWSNVFTNKSFDLDTAAPSIVPSGWTAVSGNWRVAPTAYGGLPSFTGGNFLQGVDTDYAELSQTVDLNAMGMSSTTIDAGNAAGDFSIHRANNDVSDTGRVLVQFLDATQTVISAFYDSGAETISPVDTWVQRFVTGIAVPALTRYVKCTLQSTPVAGVGDAAFDNIVCTFTETDTNTHHDIYEDRMYTVTIPGDTAASAPTYDSVVGNTTVDGTATLTAFEAWTRDGEILEQTDKANFQITTVDPLAADGWYNGGAIIMEGGANNGLVREIRSWLLATAELSIFVPFPFPLIPGQKFKLYPGCDKRFPTCGDRFANFINFRGEPYIPGDDSINVIVSS